MGDEQFFGKLFLNGKEIPITELPKIEFKHVHDCGVHVVNKLATLTMRVHWCFHCEDRDLWVRGFVVTLAPPICKTCLDTCFERGITLRTMMRGRMVVIQNRRPR